MKNSVKRDFVESEWPHESDWFDWRRLNRWFTIYVHVYTYVYIYMPFFSLNFFTADSRLLLPLQTGLLLASTGLALAFALGVFICTLICFPFPCVALTKRATIKGRICNTKTHAPVICAMPNEPLKVEQLYSTLRLEFFLETHCLTKRIYHEKCKPH